MKETGLRRIVQTVALALLVGAGAVSCAEDDFIDEGRSRGPIGSTPTFDGGLGGGEDAEESLCPSSAPKPGDGCPSRLESELRCTYVIGTCQYMSSVYDITLDFCCKRGVVWDTCGTNTTPCDNEPPPAPPPPPPTPDAGSPDAPTGG